MSGSAYVALYGAFSIAAALWLALARWRPSYWSPTLAPRDRTVPLRHVAAVTIAIIGIGQAYVAGGLFVEAGTWRTIARTMNQLLIFSPVAAGMWWIARRYPVTTRRRDLLLVPTDHVALRLVAGAMCALGAMTVYLTLRAGAVSPVTALQRLFAFETLPMAVQVLGEDAAILLGLGALSARFSARRAVVTVALLFAAAHIPAMVQRGTSAADLLRLTLDAGLAVIVVGALLRTRDVWLLWPVHTVLDAMQFYAA